MFVFSWVIMEIPPAAMEWNQTINSHYLKANVRRFESPLLLVVTYQYVYRSTVPGTSEYQYD